MSLRLHDNYHAHGCMSMCLSHQSPWISILDPSGLICPKRQMKLLMNKPANEDRYDYLGLLLKTVRLGLSSFWVETKPPQKRALFTLTMEPFPWDTHVESTSFSKRNEGSSSSLRFSSAIFLPLLIWAVVSSQICNPPYDGDGTFQATSRTGTKNRSDLRSFFQEQTVLLGGWTPEPTFTVAKPSVSTPSAATSRIIGRRNKKATPNRLCDDPRRSALFVFLPTPKCANVEGVGGSTISEKSAKWNFWDEVRHLDVDVLME